MAKAEENPSLRSLRYGTQGKRDDNTQEAPVTRQKKSPGTGNGAGLGREKSPFVYCRPGLASLSLRIIRRCSEPILAWEVPCPGEHCRSDAARRLTSRFRIGRQLHCVALKSQLTSKCRRKVCQAKSAVSAIYFAGKSIFFGIAAAAAAIGGVEVPIGGANVMAYSEAEGAGNAVDCLGCAFEFEEGADGCFIEVQVQVREAETGAEFFVAEGGSEAEGRELGEPIGGRSLATTSLSARSL